MENGNLGSIQSKNLPNSDYENKSIAKPQSLKTELDYHIKLPQNPRNISNVQTDMQIQRKSIVLEQHDLVSKKSSPYKNDNSETLLNSPSS